MAMTTDNVNKSCVKELESLEDAEISKRQENVSGKLKNQSSLIASRVQGDTWASTGAKFITINASWYELL